MSKETDDPAVEWDRIIATLDQSPRDVFNMAHECCDRWAVDRGRLAIVICHPDGRSDRITFFELSRDAARAARMLANTGLQRGDKIAAVLGRQIEAWIVALAAWRSGLVYVPLFAGFGGEAIAQRMRASDAAAVVVDAAHRDAVEDARGFLDRDVDVITVSDEKGRGLRRGDWSFWAELSRCSPDFPPVPTAANDPASIVFTSGTTSTPKGCVIPHSGFVALLPWFDATCDVDRSDVLFTTTDPGWSYGLLTTGATPMARGITRVMYTGQFDPSAWCAVMEQEQVTHIAAVPTAFRRLVDLARRQQLPSSLRGASSAGEALDEETARAWIDLTGTPIRDGYGQTELGMILGTPADDAVIPGALRCPIPGWEVKLIDEDDNTITGPGIGMIAARRPPFQLTTGYANAPEVWQSRWFDGEWFRTGDIAQRDDDGRWRFMGRNDDVIVTAGYNVGPGEIEAVLQEHPAVSEAGVVAAPDPNRGGSAVRAVIVLAPGHAPSPELTAELQASVRRGIGRHAYPRIVDYVDALPRTETGKLRRAALRTETARRIKHPEEAV